MNKFEENYSEIIREVCKRGNKITGRNGKVRQLTGRQIRADLKEGFPIVTGKKIFPKSIFVETDWMLSGNTNIDFLNDNGVHIWDKWANENGDLGKVYGEQIRNFNGVDQFKNLIEGLKNNYNSRRHIVSMWNPSDLNEMNLPPCHYSFQVVTYKNHIDLVVSMRSLDLFVGLPYDVAMYAAILSSICKEFKKEVGSVVINAAACHIYEEHISNAAIYANRDKYKLPTLLSCPTISNFKWTEFKLSEFETKSRLKVNVKE